MPDSKPKRRRRRWFRRILGVLAFAALAAAVALVLAVQHLDWIAKWSIHRLFPGVQAGLGSLRIVSASRLEVRKLTLKSSKTKEPLLALEGGTVVFSFNNIWRLRLDEIQLERPNLVVSPDLGEALGVQPAKPSEAAAPARSGGMLGWGIDHFVVNGGHLRITRFGQKSPTVDLDFSAEFKDFGVGGETGKIDHALRVEKIAATDASNRRFLKIEGADIHFTTEELFTGSRIHSARLGKGSLTILPNLIEMLSPQPKASASPSVPAPSGAQPGWSVGSLQLDGLQVTIPNAPGVIGKVDFHIAASLQNLGAVADALQSIIVNDLIVSTDAEPRIALLATEEAEVKFTVAGLAAHRVEELNFKNPVVDFAPATMEVKGTAPKPVTPSAAPAEKPPTWLIGRARCNFGTLRLRGLQDGELDVTARLAFDMQNLGTAGESANAMQTLTVWDVQVSTGKAKAFVSLDVAEIRFTTAGLLEHQHIDAVKINGGRILVGDTLQKLLAKPAAPAPAASSTPPATQTASSGWSIGTLEVASVRTRIEDKRPGVTDLHFTLNTSLTNVSASGVSGQLVEQVQTIELANIDLRSPINPAAKILSLRSVFVRFTLRDLARKHLREVVILRPNIFLNQDLFIYMERASAAPTGVPLTVPALTASVPVTLEPNWSVDHLEVKFGRLVIGSGGRTDVGLPLEFETTADNLALDNLAALQLQTVLRVRKQSREFPDYQLSVEGAEGDLRFAYPPEKGEKNLVQKLDIAGIRWRQYRAKKTWVAVTFDARGINGEFGGEAYQGYLNGGFSFFFGNDSPWIGWIAGTKVDTQTLTDVISPQNFRLTGPLDFEVQLDAFRKEIDRVRGVFHLTKPGRLKIGKLDDLLANIPPTWTAIKSSSTRIALETLRDFDYTTASGDLWFVQSQGILNLDLSGPDGSRKFEVALHDDQDTQSKWQQGKLGKK